MTQAESLPPIAAVVLAAGGSARMGQPKLLLPLGAKPMVRHVVEAVCTASFSQVVVVVGAHGQLVSAALAGLPVEIHTNEAWARGMSSSMRLGLGALRPEVEAVLIVLADQPALSGEMLRSMASHYRSTRALIVAPHHRGRRGNPVLFDHSLFAELLAVEGDQGGRELLARYRDEIQFVEVDDPLALADVDTQQDYARVRGEQW